MNQRKDNLQSLLSETGYKLLYDVYAGFFNKEKFPYGVQKGRGTIHGFRTKGQVRKFLENQKQAMAWGHEVK